MAAPGVAVAQTSDPQPVIASAPNAVAYGRDAVIVGRMEGAAPGQSLHLERKRGDGVWKRIRTESVDENGRARFPLSNLHRSAGYRLLYIDSASGATERSASERIAVVARLRMRASKHHVIEGRRLRVYGTLYPKVPGRRVRFQQRVGGRWRTVERVRAGDGSFSTYFRPAKSGFRRLRVRFAGDDYNRRASDRGAVRVYESDLATWYGPGFYGNRTACGKRLGYDTLGVAHRSLPCGTKVNILYEGRTITVPVIDRGPYSSADWDLTEETADRLGFSGTDRIGTDRDS